MSAVREGEVKQMRKWYFVSRRLLFWLAIVSSVVVGIISCSLIIDAFALPKIVTHSFVLAAPLQLFWIVIIVISTIFGWHIAKKTTNLYSWRHSTIILVSILISIIGGYVLSLTNANNVITQTMYKRSAYYQALYVQALRMNMDQGASTFDLLLERERTRTFCFKIQRTLNSCYLNAEFSEN